MYKQILIGAVALAIGLAAGYYMAAREMQSTHLLGLMTNLRWHLNFLEALRDGKAEKALEWHEKLLAQDLVVLKAETSDGKDTAPVVKELIDRANRYETKYGKAQTRTSAQ